MSEGEQVLHRCSACRVAQTWGGGRSLVVVWLDPFPIDPADLPATCPACGAPLVEHLVLHSVGDAVSVSLVVDGVVRQTGPATTVDTERYTLAVRQSHDAH